MMELQNKFSGLEQRESGDLIINTFIFVLLIFLLIVIDHSVENFFFFPQITPVTFLPLFLFHCLLSEPISKHFWEKSYGSGSRILVSWTCLVNRGLCLSSSAEWIAKKERKRYYF